MINTFWKPNRPVAGYFFCVSAAGLLLVTILNFVLNGSSESKFLLGISVERLGLLGAMLLIALALLFVGIQILRGKSFGLESDKRKSLVLGGALLAFLLTWLILSTPLERFGPFFYYISHLILFLVWLAVFSGVGVALLLADRFGVSIGQFMAFVREHRGLFGVAGVALLIFGFISIAVLFRVINMRWQEEDFWYGAGVPLLPLQVLVALLASIVLAIFAKKIEKKRWFDLVLFLCIWAVTAWAWASAPVNPDFFITKPVAPSFEMYPDYDARFFDLVSQYALIGQGLASHGAVDDRPLYSAFLVYLHTFVGQDYGQVVAWQAALYAIFPALGYLLAKRLHSRAAGLGLAALLMLRGVNSLEIGQFINTAHQKQMMTDFPTAIFVLLISILLIRWLQDPGKNWLSLGAAAGVSGLATLLRLHPIIYLPILIVLMAWVYRQKKRLWLSFTAMILMLALAGVFPWVAGNGQANMYLDRIKTVIETRYPALRPSGGSSLPAPLKVADISHTLPALLPAEKSVLAFGIDHFLNNLTTTVQVLPSTLAYQDPRDTVKKGENFWRPYWDGSLSPWARIMLPINLILIALGLGAALKRSRFSGLIPLIVMLAYDAMNALARTSGGRYIVPVDWVVIFYYLLGILTLIELVASVFRRDIFPQAHWLVEPREDVSINRAFWMRLSGLLFLFVAIGAVIPLSGGLFPQRYPDLTRKELAQQFSTRLGTNSDISSQQLYKLLAKPEAVILQGRTLYARSFEKDAGFDVSVYEFYHPKPYPRMIFTLLGPRGEARAIFPSLQPVAIPNFSDAIILGCRVGDSIQVLGILLNDSKTLLKRTPSLGGEALVCPLKEPVCDDNHHCQ